MKKGSAPLVNANKTRKAEIFDTSRTSGQFVHYFLDQLKRTKYEHATSLELTWLVCGWVIQILIAVRTQSQLVDRIVRTSRLVELFAILVLLGCIFLIVGGFVVFYRFKQDNTLSSGLLVPGTYHNVGKSRFYRTYLEVWKALIFFIEPVALGKALSALLHVTSDQASNDRLFTFSMLSIPPSVLIIVSAVVYSACIESRLPAKRICSCSNTYAHHGLVFSTRLAVALDQFSSSGPVHEAYGVFINSAKIVCKLILAFWTVFGTAYYDKRFGNMVIAAEVITIFLLLSNLIVFTASPVAFVAIIAMMAVRLTQQSKNSQLVARLRKKNELTFEETLGVCWSLLNSADLDPSSSADQIIKLASFVHQVKNKTKVNLAAFRSEVSISRESLTESDEKVHTKFLMLDLFERQLALHPSRGFEICLFELYFLQRVDSRDLYLTSVLFGRLKSLAHGLVQLQEMQEVAWLIEENFRRLAFTSVTAKTNAMFSDALHFVERKVIDLEEPPGEQVFENSQSAEDLHRCLLGMRLYDVFTRMLEEVIRDVLFLYDRLQMGIAVHEIHGTILKVMQGKAQCSTMFAKLDSTIGRSQISHLLPYIVFLDIVDNNQDMCRRMVKSFRSRLSLKGRFKSFTVQSVMSSNGQDIDLSDKVIMASRCSKTDLGKITYLSRNFEHVMDSDSVSLMGKSISSMLPGGYQAAHAKCMQGFYSGLPSTYFNTTKIRVITLDSQQDFKRVVCTSRLCPTLPNNEMIVMTVMIKLQHTEDLVVVDDCCKIVGIGAYNQYLVGKDVVSRLYARSISDSLELKLQNLVKEFSLKNKNDFRHTIAKMNSTTLSETAEVDGQEKNADSFDLDIRDSKLTYGLTVFENIQAKVVVNWMPGEGGQNNAAIWFDVFINHPDAMLVDKALLKKFIDPSTHKGSILHNVNLDSPTKTKGSLAMLGRDRSLRQSIDENSKERAKNLRNLVLEGSSISHGGKSSIESVPIKVLLKTAISKKMKSFIRKELFCALVIQLAVWSMCAFLTIEIDTFFGKELVKIIELRSGFHFMILAYTNLFNQGIFMVDLEMNYRGMGRGSKKYAVLTSKDVQNSETNFKNAYARGTTAANSLRRHIYSFELAYANRYLATTMDYVHRLDNNSTQTVAKSNINIVQNQQLALYVSRYWHDHYKQSTLDSYHVQEFLDLMGDCWIKVGVQTMIHTVDVDNQQFEKKLQNLNVTIIVAICLSFFLAYLFVFVMYLIISKIRDLYSTFSVLYEDEIQSMKDQLAASLDIIDRCAHGRINDAENFNEVFTLVKTDQRSTKRENLNLQAKPRKYRRVAKIRKGSLFNRCLGMAFMVFLISALMQSFGMTALIALEKQAQRASRLLVLMGMHRKLGTTNATMNFINFRTYVLALKIAGKGFGLRSLQHYKDEFQDVLKRYLAFEGDLEAFIYDNQGRLKEDNVGFEVFLEGKPCDWFDKTRNMTSGECAALANGEMAKRIVNVYRWQRITILNLAADIEALTPANALEILGSKTFLELEYLRMYFSLPFFVSFSGKFYGKILENQLQVTKSTQGIIFVMLSVGILLTIVLNVYGYAYIGQQMSIGLQGFLLLPSVSYIGNPYVAAKIASLRY